MIKAKGQLSDWWWCEKQSDDFFSFKGCKHAISVMHLKFCFVAPCFLCDYSLKPQTLCQKLQLQISHLTHCTRFSITSENDGPPHVKIFKYRSLAHAFCYLW